MAKKFKALRDTENYWELDGESVLNAATFPAKPKADAPTTIRVTHSNAYGPVDDADIFVRVGDPKKPTKQTDLKSGTGWVKATLEEELVTVEDEEMLREDADEPFEDETPWDGTYEATLKIPAGNQSIEIKVISRTEVLSSLVLSDWTLKV